MTTERTFSNYIKLVRGIGNSGRYGSNEHSSITHELSNKKTIQKYGNSYIISFPRRKMRFIIGPHWLGVLVTILLIFGGSYMNIRMLEQHSEYSQQTIYMFKVFIAVFFVLTNFFLICTATSDPGIVFHSSSNSVDPVDGNNDHHNHNNAHSSNGRNSNSNQQHGGEDFNLEEIPYCEVCDVYQPDHLNIYHCSECNYCIENMDHHCPWMVGT